MPDPLVSGACFPLTKNLNPLSAFGSGVGTAGSSGSMNRGPELLEPPSSGATEKKVTTLRKIIKNFATR